MRTKKNTIFSWDIPENIFISGGINCSRKVGGCGRWHDFEVDEEGEITFDITWENSRGEFECEKFEELEAEARAEWESKFKEQFLTEQERSQEREKANERQADRRPQREKGVKLEDRQFEKEWGAIRPVGFYRKREEIFICGNCSQEVKGSLRHGKVKNRNNPLF